MALSDDQLAAVRAQIGETKEPKDSELDDIHDRVGTVNGVILEVFNKRLASILEAPASFSVSGYSENNTANIEALRKKIEQYEAIVLAETQELTGGSTITTIPLHRVRPLR